MSGRAPIPWWVGPAAFLGALAIRLLGATWRIERVGVEAYGAAGPNGEPCVFALWHARLLPLAYVHRGWRAAVLISRHRDGELIARAVRHLGYQVARGSSTRGGARGLREILDWTARGFHGAVTPDGPRGPAERVKPGLAYLASRAGLAVVPVAGAARSSWVLRSWDRFRIPKPFARLVVAYGPPVRIPPDLGAADIAAWSGRLQDAMRETTATARRLAGET